MRSINRAIPSISRPKRRYYRAALAQLMWAVALGLMPLILAGIFFMVGTIDGSVKSLFSEGQLALYAASALGTALYISSDDRSFRPFPARSWFLLASFLVVMVAMALYASIAEDALGASQSDSNLSEGAVIAISGVVYGAAVILTFWAVVTDNQRVGEAVSMSDKLKQGASNLSERIDKVGDELDEE